LAAVVEAPLFFGCFEPDRALVEVVTPALLPLLEAASAGWTEVADEVPGATLEECLPAGLTRMRMGLSCPAPASASVVVVVWALVATPAIDATTTVTTRTTPTTNAERRRVEAALRRKAGRARNRSPT